MIKPVICIGLGVLLLGYSFYSAFFTGSEFERFSLLSGGKAAVNEVRLSPDMNPLRVLVRAKRKVQWTDKDIREKLDKEVEVNVVMSDSAGKTLWEESARFDLADDEATSYQTRDSTQFLRTFEVVSDGDYTFSGHVIVHHGTPDTVELIAKRNVTQVSLSLVIVGVLTLIAGVAFVVFEYKKTQSDTTKQKHPDASLA